jgi:CDP-paratose 2-epimerase
MNRPSTVYGNGKQVRDLLHVDDLMDAFDAVIEKRDSCAGRVYNIGGGPANGISIWYELKPILERLAERDLDVSFADWRPGDQRIYVSDIRRAQAELAWTPRISVEQGVERLYRWVQEHKHYFT